MTILKLKRTFETEIYTTVTGHVAIEQKATMHGEEDQVIVFAADQLPIIVQCLRQLFETRDEWENPQEDMAQTMTHSAKITKICPICECEDGDHFDHCSARSAMKVMSDTERDLRQALQWFADRATIVSDGVRFSVSPSLRWMAAWDTLFPAHLVELIRPPASVPMPEAPLPSAPTDTAGDRRAETPEVEL